MGSTPSFGFSSMTTWPVATIFSTLPMFAPIDAAALGSGLASFGFGLASFGFGLASFGFGLASFGSGVAAFGSFFSKKILSSFTPERLNRGSETVTFLR